MDIEVGEYVRTPEQGFIGKLVEINRYVTNYYKIDVGREIRRPDGHSDHYIYSRDGLGLKHSKNIKDLIQVGDYVNGMEVLNIKNKTIYVEWSNEFDEYTGFVDENTIKTILTKEQYEANCYRLEDKR